MLSKTRVFERQRRFYLSSLWFHSQLFVTHFFVLQKFIVKKLSPKIKYEKHKKTSFNPIRFFCLRCSSVTVHYDMINFIGLDKQKVLA